MAPNSDSSNTGDIPTCEAPEILEPPPSGCEAGFPNERTTFRGGQADQFVPCKSYAPLACSYAVPVAADRRFLCRLILEWARVRKQAPTPGKAGIRIPP